MHANKERRGGQGYALILWLVWGSMLFSLLIFAAVPILIPPPPDFSTPTIAAGPTAPLMLIFGAATIALIPILVKSRKNMFFKTAAEAGYPNDEAARMAYFSMALTSWVFCELIGVFGLTMAYMTFDPVLSLPFMGVAALLLGVFRPRPAVAEARPGGQS